MNLPSVRDPVQIGRVVQHAVVFDPRRVKGGDVDSLLETVRRLFALMEERKADCVLVGGIAMLQHVEGRNTEDVDLILAEADLQRLPEIRVDHLAPPFARGRFGDLRVDVLLADHPLFARVRSRYAEVRPFAERDLRCATVEGLILLKLYALPSLYRQGDFVRVGLYENDVATLMQAYRPALEPLLEELRPHLGEPDLASVRGILDEIRQRIARFGKGLR